MKAVTYITENTIMKFLYNPKKTFLEGFVDEESQRLYKASRINAEKDEAYWNGYWDGFIG